MQNNLVIGQQIKETKHPFTPDELLLSKTQHVSVGEQPIKLLLTKILTFMSKMHSGWFI